MAVGTICYSVMVSLGEMIAYLPIPGGHIKLAGRFVDPALSFTMGWNYWYNWVSSFSFIVNTDECISSKVIILPAELSAAAVLINYWNQEVNNAVWITIFMIVVIVINMFGAGVYGECEFIFAYVYFSSLLSFPLVLIVLGLSGPSKSSLSLASSFSESFWILEEVHLTTDWASGTGRSQVLSSSTMELVEARVNFWVNSHLVSWVSQLTGFTIKVGGQS